MSKLDQLLDDLAGSIDAWDMRKGTKEAIKDLITELIGENEPEFSTPQPDLPAMSRNRLREELRAKVRAL